MDYCGYFFLIANWLCRYNITYGINNTKSEYKAEVVSICLIVNCGILSPYYWKAEIVIPTEIAKDGILIVLLTDNKGREIKNGIFTLL